jgi:two-component system CheB/CheR fusion protein
VQGLLSRSDEQPITIGLLIRTELEAVGGEAALRRVEVEGPDVLLRKSAVQTLSLALHELATNARKYGALSNGDGRLEVTWRVIRDIGTAPRLLLDWIERSSAPYGRGQESTGYGRELIERALPYSLGARTRYELASEGVRCAIDLPLTQGQP